MSIQFLETLARQFFMQDPALLRQYASTLAELTNSLQQASIESDRILKLIKEGSLKDFFDMKPVSGLTLLTVAAAIDDGTLQKVKETISAQNKLLADMRHSRPGGAREKRKKIRAIWALGKYKSRDLCAEKEHEALGMSFSAARKALIGTPRPENSG
jgi:hypothetical protein